MFKKLDFTFDIDIDRIKNGERVVSYSHAIDENDQSKNRYSEAFISYALKDTEYFNEILSRTLKFHIQPYAVNYTELSNEGAYPHIDGPIIALNYYLQTENDATLFWEIADSSIKAVSVPQGVNGGPVYENNTAVAYDPTKLKLINYFVAKSNEAYLFDTSAIHSISKRNYNSVRKFIRFFWDRVTFDEVLNSIEILPKQHG
jgi:hypothetical protein